MSIGLQARFEGLMAKRHFSRSQFFRNQQFFDGLTRGDIVIAGHSAAETQRIREHPGAELQFLMIYEASVCACGDLEIAENQADDAPIETSFAHHDRRLFVLNRVRQLRGHLLEDKDLIEDLELKPGDYYGGFALVMMPEKGVQSYCFYDKRLSLAEGVSLMHAAFYNTD